ncbi:thymidine kinase [Klebsiella phage CPRSA]|nr:thymidine kinase [Klebsiella phage CPRSA]
MCRVVDELDIPVMTYGLRTDFQLNLFEGSYMLLALADEIRELPGGLSLWKESNYRCPY